PADASAGWGSSLVLGPWDPWLPRSAWEPILGRSAPRPGGRRDAERPTTVPTQGVGTRDPTLRTPPPGGGLPWSLVLGLWLLGIGHFARGWNCRWMARSRSRSTWV